MSVSSYRGIITMKVLLAVLGGCLSFSTVFGLLCQVCNRARALEQCPQIAHCSGDQECFVDEIIDSNGIFFNAGCRSKEVCNQGLSFPGIGKREVLTSSVDKRQNDELIACSRCCAHDFNLTSSTSKPCNTRLCGLPSNSGSNHLTCYQCDRVNNFEDDCNEVTTCSNDKVCGSKTEATVSGNKLYSFGCYDKRMCIAFTKKVLALHDLQEQRNHTTGKRSDIRLCNVCCGGSYCNTGDCYKLEKKLHELAKYGNLNLNTLEYI